MLSTFPVLISGISSAHALFEALFHEYRLSDANIGSGPSLQFSGFPKEREMFTLSWRRGIGGNCLVFPPSKGAQPFVDLVARAVILPYTKSSVLCRGLSSFSENSLVLGRE